MEEKNFQLLKIGELAAMAGISVKALRVYEKKNIIKPVKIDDVTGYRYYSPDQFKQIEALIELQDMGFTLAEISRILSGKCAKEDLSALFDAKAKALQENIWKLEAKMKELAAMKKTVEQGEAADHLSKMSDEERAWYLAKLVRINEENIRQVLSDVLWL